MTNLLLIKGSRVRVPPGSPRLAETIESSDSSGQLTSPFELLIGSESSTQIPFAWERLRLLTERNGCRSEQFVALQAITFPHPPFRRIAPGPLTALWISDWFGEEILIERELAALEAGQ